MVSDEGRGFLGFRAIIAEQAYQTDSGADLRTTTRYHDAFPLTGRIAMVEQHLAHDAEDATPIRATETIWESSCHRGVCFVAPAVHTERVHDLETRASLSTTTTTTTYSPDDRTYGNPSIVTVETDDPFTIQTRQTQFRYDYSDADSWWIDKLVRQTVADVHVGYKRGPYPEAESNPVKGVATIFDWYSGDDARLLREQVVHTTDPAQQQRTHYEYDTHGNLLRPTVHTLGGDPPRRMSWTYDTDGYLATSEANPAGHVTTLRYAPETGLLLEENRYGIHRGHSYDGLGRLVRTHSDGAPPIHVVRLRCNASCPRAARMRVVTVQDGAPTTWQYLDMFGRALKSTTSGFDGAEDIMRIAQYDPRGRLVRESRPGTQTDGLYYTAYSRFDALGRPGRKVVDRRGHAHATFTTDYAYEGMTTHIGLPGGLVATRTFDAHGLPVETVDTGGSTTHYRHDAHGNTTLIEDTAGNRWTARYDDLGHRVYLSAPDSGTWTFVYNGHGELIHQTDANGRQSSFYPDPGAWHQQRAPTAQQYRPQAKQTERVIRAMQDADPDPGAWHQQRAPTAQHQQPAPNSRGTQQPVLIAHRQPRAVPRPEAHVPPAGESRRTP